MKSDKKISVVQLLKPHWKALSLGLLAAVASATMDILQPWPLKIVIDNVILGKALSGRFVSIFGASLGTDRAHLLNLAAGSLIVIAIAGALASYFQNMLMTSVGQWVMHGLRTTLYHHIQRLSLSYHDQSQTGDLIGRVTD